MPSVGGLSLSLCKALSLPLSLICVFSATAFRIVSRFCSLIRSIALCYRKTYSRVVDEPVKPHNDKSYGEVLRYVSVFDKT